MIEPGLNDLLKEEMLKCDDCGTDWEKVEEESGENHEVYEPACQCYEKDIMLSVG